MRAGSHPLFYASMQQESFMAYVTRFFHLDAREARRVHRTTECSWHLTKRDGAVVVQLDTYGSADRQDTGTISQSLQLDEDRARELVRILSTTFPALRV